MEKRSYLGTILTLAGVNALTLSVAGVLTHYINLNMFAGFVLMGCVVFFAGLTMMRDQLTHE